MPRTLISLSIRKCFSSCHWVTQMSVSAEVHDAQESYPDHGPSSRPSRDFATDDDAGLGVSTWELARRAVFCALDLHFFFWGGPDYCWVVRFPASLANILGAGATDRHSWMSWSFGKTIKQYFGLYLQLPFFWPLFKKSECSFHLEDGTLIYDPTLSYAEISDPTVTTVTETTTFSSTGAGDSTSESDDSTSGSDDSTSAANDGSTSGAGSGAGTTTAGEPDSFSSSMCGVLIAGLVGVAQLF